MNTKSDRDYLIYYMSKLGGLCIGTDCGGFWSWGPDCEQSIAGEMWVRVMYPSARRVDEDEFWRIANARYEEYMGITK
jgi:hypothetical protein